MANRLGRPYAQRSNASVVGWAHISFSTLGQTKRLKRKISLSYSKRSGLQKKLFHIVSSFLLKRFFPLFRIISYFNCDLNQHRCKVCTELEQNTSSGITSFRRTVRPLGKPDKLEETKTQWTKSNLQTFTVIQSQKITQMDSFKPQKPKISYRSTAACDHRRWCQFIVKIVQRCTKKNI